MNTYEHIKDVVPQSIADKMKGFIEDIELDDFLDVEYHGCERIEPIHGVAFDGFAPFQDGGFYKGDYARCDCDPISHLTEKQAECMELQQSTCFDMMKDDLGFNYESPNLTDVQESMCSEYEQDWIEPQFVKIMCYADDGMIITEARHNYRDAPYYRDGKDDIIAAFRLTFKEFERLGNSQLEAYLQTAIKHRYNYYEVKRG